MKNILRLKLKYISITPDNETGLLIQPQSLQLHRGKWSGVFGAVYYKTESWNSRLYLIEPGLKGEFRLQPYYIEGCLLYSRFNLQINKSNLFLFRYSLQISTANDWALKPEMGLQLDIVFRNLNKVNFKECQLPFPNK